MLNIFKKYKYTIPPLKKSSDRMLVHSKSMKESSLIIFISSRNNYDMLYGEVLRNVDFEGFPLINVDDFSTYEEKEKGRKFCSDFNVLFLENKKRGIQWATKTVSNYLTQINSKCKWIIHISHDCYPISENLFSGIEDLILNDKINQMGCLGFNFLDFHVTRDAIRMYKKKQNVCGAVGRAVLTQLPNNAYWYRPDLVYLDWNLWGGPFAIECVCDAALGINLELFRKYVEVSDKYHLFCWADDICMQFLNQGILNIVIPKFYFFNNKTLKEKYMIPIKSASTIKKDKSFEKYFGDYGNHLQYWKDKWGWDREEKQSFENVKERYQGKIIVEFYEHDFSMGPLKTFRDVLK